MQLTRHTDYALRVLIFLALQPKGTRVTITDIAGHFEIPRNHLVKVVQRLGQLGYIHTLRGKGGGIRLGGRPADIRVGEVVRRVEFNLDIVDCRKPLCPLLPVCSLKGALNEARDAFLNALDRYTLHDLVRRPDGLRQALHWPAPAPSHGT